jgi:hypothetical protein
MPNRFLTHEEVSQMFLDELTEASGGDEKKMRALVYDFQTRAGGFPSSPEERQRYIDTGHT